MTRFKDEYGKYEISEITSEDVMSFLTKVTDGKKQSTKKLKFSLLRSFFNFIEIITTCFHLDTPGPVK
ncbi:site-specific integrase [Desulfobacula phenolica]|uniref:site-specific integrase n=1 Tax=Desulfobacula phenolica TaxID=90732 RepID=UPI003898F251